jgi:hypothetical protein
MQIIPRNPVATTPSGDISLHVLDGDQVHLCLHGAEKQSIALTAPELGGLLHQLRALGEISISLARVSKNTARKEPSPTLLVFAICDRPVLAYVSAENNIAAIYAFGRAFPKIPILATTKGLFYMASSSSPRMLRDAEASDVF